MSDCFEPEPSAESHLKIMSINLGNNIFKNMLDGSEKRKVEHCREEYHNSSKCTQNVAEFMDSQGPDILGLQECSRNVSTFVEWMGGEEMYTGHQEKVGSHLSACAVVYNHHTMGQHESIDLKHEHEMSGEWAAYKEIHGVRSAAAVFFPKHGMIFASVWMGHLSEQSLKSALEQFAQTVYKSVPATISRMVVAMDSNDYSDALSGFSVLIDEGTDMRLKHNGSPHSCCDDTEYAYPGDYIMDTESNTRTVLMDVGGGFDPNLMSDHKPVCLEVEKS